MSNETSVELPAWMRTLIEGGELDTLRLSATGVWSYRGTCVEHPKVIALFSRSIRRTVDGLWVLAIGRYVYPIEVEDTALFVVDCVAVDDLLRLSLSDGTEQTVGAVALSYSETGIYAELDNGLTARFARRAHFDFAEQCLQEGEALSLRFGSTTLRRRDP